MDLSRTLRGTGLLHRTCVFSTQLFVTFDTCCSFSESSMLRGTRYKCCEQHGASPESNDTHTYYWTKLTDDPFYKPVKQVVAPITFTSKMCLLQMLCIMIMYWMSVINLSVKYITF